mmetsp:Transcript_18629/g.53872  ORF Transcript_18629/g.53872 Transcript_18629/m.53872 type:complete len:228 (+) Transcript_18629:179-862(+)
MLSHISNNRSPASLRCFSFFDATSLALTAFASIARSTIIPSNKLSAPKTKLTKTRMKNIAVAGRFSMIGVLSSLQPSPTISCWTKVNMDISTEENARAHRSQSNDAQYPSRSKSCTIGWMKRVAKTPQTQVNIKRKPAPIATVLEARSKPWTRTLSSGNKVIMRNARVNFMMRANRAKTIGIKVIVIMITMSVTMMSIETTMKSNTQIASEKNEHRKAYNFKHISMK